jgi:hypothetical protein
VLNNQSLIEIPQYADNGILFINNEKVLREAISTINVFDDIAGTKLHMTKCGGLLIG